MAAIYSILSALSSVALARSPRLAPHRVTRIVACAIPPTSSPSEDAHGANAKRQRGRRRRSKPHDTSETPRRRITLQHAEDGLPPEIARCYPEQYDELLRGKVGRLEALLEDATPSADNLPPTEVFESERTHFRMRASFKIWREDEGLAYAMFNRDDARMPHEVLTYPMGSRRINELMTPLREALSSERVLKERINDLRFLTTTTGDALATVTYNKPIGAEWADAAERVADTLGMSLVGRSRKVKLVVGGGETVTECLRVPERGECIYTQTEGAFTQPNAGVCEKMLGWAYRATRDSGGGGGGGDLCELYCGSNRREDWNARAPIGCQESVPRLVGLRSSSDLSSPRPPADGPALARVTMVVQTQMDASPLPSRPTSVG